MSERYATDVLVVGAGIAGAGVAAQLAAGGRDVLLVEQEDRPGRHATGRSAAIFIQNYGNAVIRALSRASAPWFEARDRRFFPEPLLSPRGLLVIADHETLPALERLLDEAEGLERIDGAQARDHVPILRAERIAGAAYEADARDIDVAALHQGWLKQAKAAGATLLTRAALAGAVRREGHWHVETRAGTIEAGTIVNAAGAWADRVAVLCGLAPIGLTPMRRSMAVLPAPAGRDCRHWPLFADAADRWYCKPETGRLLVSPADEEPVEPHDAFADDMVLAEGLDRYQQAVSEEVTRVDGNWAGLRTFVHDRTPVVGFEPGEDGFFWLAGQGGYGMQTAPAVSRLAAELINGGAPLQSAEARAMSPARLRD